MLRTSLTAVLAAGVVANDCSVARVRISSLGRTRRAASCLAIAR